MADLHALNAMLDNFFKKVDPAKLGYRVNLKAIPEAAPIVALTPQEKAEVAVLLLERQGELHAAWKKLEKAGKNPGGTNSLLWTLFDGVAGRRLPFTAEQAEKCFEWMQTSGYVSIYSSHLGFLMRLAEDFAAKGALSPLGYKVVKRIRDELGSSQAAERKFKAQAEALLNQGAPVLKNPIIAGEAWADAALAWTEKKTAWIALLQHCQTASSAKPSAKWNTTAKKLLKDVGSADFAKAIAEWFPLLNKPRTGETKEHNYRMADTAWLIAASNEEILRGLAWTAALVPDKDVPRALAVFIESALKKLPGIGPRSPKLANAGIYALGVLSSPEALAQLARLKVRVRFGTALKQIEKAFDTAAASSGLPRDQIEEMSVPSYGLEADGTRTETLGDVTATIRIEGSDVLLEYSRAGKALKSVPAKTKEEFKEELKELQSAVKDIRSMLPAQAQRIDGLFLQEKSWSIAQAKERYLDHPLIGTLARRLIWTLDNVAVLYRNGAFEDVAGKAVKHGTTAELALWHPAGKSTTEILAWRKRLEALNITQPFKQAYREIYLLTDAERNTRTYSNRFAAHIIKQHQFNTLAIGRGWKSKLRLLVDDAYTAPCKLLPQFNLRAEFWLEGAGDDHGVDTNETGVFLRLATDQVRFYPLDAAQPTAHATGGGYDARHRNQAATDPLPLEQIPPLVFSEIMRDVDLFVGVCSIGNDPNWTDGAHNADQNAYWQAYSFGDLSATAQTRRVVLETLLPRLAIGPQCSLSDKFLIVKGTKRTYKIHLGSGNILMEPNDQYLCIVPDSSARAAGGDLYLPFEGDNTLSIILSKAFLLAADQKIKDPTIVRQIEST